MAEHPTEYMSIVSSIAEEPRFVSQRPMASTAKTGCMASEAIKQVQQTYNFAVRISNQTVEQGEGMADLRKQVADLLSKVEALDNKVSKLVAKDKKRDKREEQLKNQVKALNGELKSSRMTSQPARAPRAVLAQRAAIQSQTIFDSTCGLPEGC